MALSAHGSDLIINEFMADNDSTITNSLNQTSDWIEVYNTSGTNINLGG
jgi:hypothetical protein